MRAAGCPVDCLGVDRFPFMATDALRQQGFSLRDADTAFIPARAVKLPIEIPYLREALRRVQEAVHALEAAIQPGRSENTLWAHLWFDLMQQDGQFLTTRLCQSGPRTFPYFQEAGPRLLETGDLVCLATDSVWPASFRTSPTMTRAGPIRWTARLSLAW